MTMLLFLSSLSPSGRPFVLMILVGVPSGVYFMISPFASPVNMFPFLSTAIASGPLPVVIIFAFVRFPFLAYMGLSGGGAGYHASTSKGTGHSNSHMIAAVTTSPIVSIIFLVKCLVSFCFVLGILFLIFLSYILGSTSYSKLVTWQD